MPLTRINNLGITDGTIVNADIATAAAIATTKLGAGAVLQVVTATYSTQSESSSSSYVATGLTASITPSATANKILILYSLPLRNSTANINVVSSIFKNGSNLLGSFGNGILKTDSTATMATATANYLDSPNTTSSTTYAIYVNPTSVTAQWCGANSTASITLLEIKG